MVDRSASYKYKCANGMIVANLLEFLAFGGGDEATLDILANDLIEYITDRRDCADFRAAYLVRIIYSFADMLPARVYDEIKKVLLGFPYEDCGGHSMCTWTENHRLYAAGTEYLMAQKFPNAVFGDGRDSDYHSMHGEKELKLGLDEMCRYGFAEWGSNNYYSETMAGLANLVQFVKNEKIREQAKEMLYMMVYDVLSRTSSGGGYVFNPACGRAYADNKVSSEIGNYMEVQVRAMRGEEVTRFKEKEGCMILLLKAKDERNEPLFRIPEEWLKMPDEDARETAMVQGVDIDEYKDEGLAAYTHENVRFAFKAGAFSDYRVICRSMRYLKETGLVENGMLKTLKPFAIPVLYRTGILKAIKKHVPSFFDGAAMEKGKVYTWACRNYSVSAAFDYRVGQVLFQQNSLAVNLSHRISLFATNPYSGSGKTGSPGYWIGSGIAPRAAACRNFGVCIFDPGLAKKEYRYTHLFFPVGLFDETDLTRLNEGILFGRTGQVNVCVRTNPGVKFIPYEESLKDDIAMYQDRKIPKDFFKGDYDLINRAAGLHYYAFEVNDTTGFAEFKQETLSRKCEFAQKEKRLCCKTGRNGKARACDISLTYDGPFEVDGKEFCPDFRRPREFIREGR